MLKKSHTNCDLFQLLKCAGVWVDDEATCEVIASFLKTHNQHTVPTINSQIIYCATSWQWTTGFRGWWHPKWASTTKPLAYAPKSWGTPLLAQV